MSNAPLLIGAAALLALLSGGKKGKKKPSGSGGGADDSIDNGSDISGPDNNKPSNNSDESSGGGGNKKAPSNLAKDAVWVSSDCKTVVYGDGTGEAFWLKKGLPVAKKFIAANYHDPYEIARLMVQSMAPCAIEFPIEEDGNHPMEEELQREMFNRNFTEVYYLIQFLHDKLLDLLDMHEYLIEFDDNCNVTFVGKNWLNPVAERMARFYLEYSYPLASEKGDVFDKTWSHADKSEKSLSSYTDNVALAIINRMNPECGISIANAFLKDPTSAKSFFNSRPKTKAMYDSLIEMIDWVDDNRSGYIFLK